MKFKLTLLFSVLGFFFLPKNSLSQKLSIEQIEGKYEYYHKPNHIQYLLKFYKKDRFEFILDDPFDCTPQFALYGIGNYKLLDSNYIELDFDSLQALSAHQIEKIANKSENINLKIHVENDNHIPLDYVTLSWNEIDKNKSIPKEKVFDRKSAIELSTDQKELQLKVKKIGFLPETINLKLSPENDYKITVTLMEKGSRKSKSFVSNQKLKIKFTSECQLLFNDVILKKENCP